MDQLRDFRDRCSGGVYVRGQQPDLFAELLPLNGRTALAHVQATFFRTGAGKEVRCGNTDGVAFDGAARIDVQVRGILQIVGLIEMHKPKILGHEQVSEQWRLCHPGLKNGERRAIEKTFAKRGAGELHRFKDGLQSMKCRRYLLAAADSLVREQRALLQGRQVALFETWSSPIRAPALTNPILKRFVSKGAECSRGARVVEQHALAQHLPLVG